MKIGDHFEAISVCVCVPTWWYEVRMTGILKVIVVNNNNNRIGTMAPAFLFIILFLSNIVKIVCHPNNKVRLFSFSCCDFLSVQCDVFLFFFLDLFFCSRRQLFYFSRELMLEHLLLRCSIVVDPNKTTEWIYEEKGQRAREEKWKKVSWMVDQMFVLSILWPMPTENKTKRKKQQRKCLWENVPKSYVELL